jgi:tRNA dimethylallyltransferase
MSLARQHGRSILVADSRQVYRRLDIGTAKPSPTDQRLVKHFGIDLVDPTERYSAARWAGVASELLTHPGAPPIVVGGTGMYLRALFQGLFNDPSADDDRRESVIGWLDSRSTEELRRWTERIDPQRASLGRTQHLRALTVALLSGRRISDLHEAEATRPAWNPRYLVIDPGAALHRQIEQRLDAMLAAGWLDEVRSLADLPDDAPAWKTTGYRALRDVARGTATHATAREKILIETRQYAKRQRTWFRHQLPAEHTTLLDPSAPDAAERIAAWWSNGERGPS